MPSPAAVLRDQRRQQLARDRTLARELTFAYQAVLGRARADLNDLTARIAAARTAGTTVNRNWLLQEARLDRIIGDLRLALRAFALGAGATIDTAALEAAVSGTLDADRMLAAQLPPSFTIPTGVPDEALVAAVARGRLLGSTRLLEGHADETVARVRDTLLEAVGLGKGPRLIAAEVREVLRAPYWQALRLARTETITAYRDSAVDRYADSGAVDKWVWLAKLDGRTCPVCLAMSGTLHPLTERLASHPNCRCIPAPVTKSWAELGFPGLRETRLQTELGADWFKRQPKALQRAILGPGKHDLYAAGDLQLADLVAETEHPVWGAGRRERSLQEVA